MGKKFDLIIVGGGIAGLMSAYNAIKRFPKLEILILEKNKCEESTASVAAGMLAPINELEFGEDELLDFGIEARKYWDKFEEEFPYNVGFEKSGTIEIALTKDDIPYLERRFTYQKNKGLDVKMLSRTELHKLEPMLSPNISHGILAKNDIQLENKLLLQQLKKFLREQSCIILENTEVIDYKSISAEITVFTKNENFTSEKVIFTIGASTIKAKKPNFQITPIRGEVILLKKNPGEFVSRIIRMLNKNLGDAYLVPKKNYVLIGSSSEERGLEKENKLGNIFDIIRKTFTAVPKIYDLNILEINHGFRPASLNRHPIFAKENNAEIYHLNGLYRHGILYSALAGKIIIDLTFEKQHGKYETFHKIL